jgi:hypothetical protein
VIANNGWTKMKTLGFAALFAAILAARPAPASFLDGHSLLRLCGGNSADKSACTGYIQGASDQWNLYRALTRTAQCGPETLTGGQLRDVVVVYLQKHPEHLIDSAAALVVEAMTASWKCK